MPEEKSPERLDLEARAERLDLDVPWNIGDEKLKERVEAAEAEAEKKIAGAENSAEQSGSDAPSPAPSAPVSTENQAPTDKQAERQPSDAGGGSHDPSPEPTQTVLPEVDLPEAELIEAVIVSPLKRDGKTYAIGDPIALDRGEFATLKAQLVVGAA